MRLSIIPIIIFLLISSLACKAQAPPYARSKLTCGDTTYIEKRPAWSIELEEGCKSEFYRNNFTDISDKHFAIIEKIEASIIERGGETFYKKLTLDAIDITKVKNKECMGTAYVLRYVYNIEEGFNYRFALYFDENGNSIKEYAFPSALSDPDFMTMVNPCPLIDSAISDAEFDKFYAPTTNKMINYIALEYDVESDKFMLVVVGKEKYGEKIPAGASSISGWFYGRKVYFDAKSGNKIKTDRFKIWKNIRLM